MYIIQVKWRKEQFQFHIADEKTTIEDIKKLLFEKTTVLPQDQKILGAKPIKSTDRKKSNLSVAALRGRPSSSGTLIKLMMLGRCRAEQDFDEAVTNETMSQIEAERIASIELREAARRERIERAKREKAEREERKRQHQEYLKTLGAINSLVQDVQVHLEATPDRSVKCSFTLAAYDINCAFAQHTPSNSVASSSCTSKTTSGNKALLPQNCLKSLLEKNASFPVIFSIQPASQISSLFMVDDDNQLRSSNSSCEKKSVCSVAQFDAPENVVFLPTSLMQRLDLSSGEDVYLETLSEAQCPSATFIRLQPLDFRWTHLNSFEHRTTLLEQQLRNYHALSVGDIVEIHHNSAQFQLEVVDLEPNADASRLLNTDVSLDVIEPKSKITDTHQMLTLQQEESVLDSYTLTGKKRKLFYAVLPVIQDEIVLQVEQHQGKSSIFVSQTNPTPSESDCMWFIQNSKLRQKIQLEKELLMPGIVFICVENDNIESTSSTSTSSSSTSDIWMPPEPEEHPLTQNMNINNIVKARRPPIFFYEMSNISWNQLDKFQNIKVEVRRFDTSILHCFNFRLNPEEDTPQRVFELWSDRFFGTDIETRFLSDLKEYYARMGLTEDDMVLPSSMEHFKLCHVDEVGGFLLQFRSTELDKPLSTSCTNLGNYRMVVDISAFEAQQNNALIVGDGQGLLYKLHIAHLKSGGALSINDSFKFFTPQQKYHPFCMVVTKNDTTIEQLHACIVRRLTPKAYLEETDKQQFGAVMDDDEKKKKNTYKFKTYITQDANEWEYHLIKKNNITDHVKSLYQLQIGDIITQKTQEHHTRCIGIVHKKHFPTSSRSYNYSQKGIKIHN